MVNTQLYWAYRCHSFERCLHRDNSYNFHKSMIKTAGQEKVKEESTWEVDPISLIFFTNQENSIYILHWFIKVHNTCNAITSNSAIDSSSGPCIRNFPSVIEVDCVRIYFSKSLLFRNSHIHIADVYSCKIYPWSTDLVSFLQ